MLKRALCVGINTFKNYPAAELRGCLNDARNIGNMLQKVLGFSSQEITALTNEQATKANIMEELNRMVDWAKSRQEFCYLVFSLSTHGTHVPDVSGDEPDNADEAFCPYDLTQKGDHWDLEHLIVDDELGSLMSHLPENSLCEVILDTCYSGTGLKAIDLLLDRKPRFLPPPSVIVCEALEKCKNRSVKDAVLESGGKNQILWSASRFDQTSSDAKIGDEWNGAFTYYFCRAMLEDKARAPRLQILQEVRNQVVKPYQQTPQLECSSLLKKSSFGTPVGQPLSSGG